MPEFKPSGVRCDRDPILAGAEAMIAGTVFGFALPRMEHAYLSDFRLNLSASTQAFLSTAASRMMALTGIVFVIGIVVVQFSAAAYSPRMALLGRRRDESPISGREGAVA
jgi:uncharacterized membrane protein